MIVTVVFVLHIPCLVFILSLNIANRYRFELFFFFKSSWNSLHFDIFKFVYRANHRGANIITKNYCACVCVCVCAHMYVYMYVCMHVCMYAYIHTFIHVRCTHTYTQACIHTYIHPSIPTFTSSLLHIPITLHCR